MINYSKKFVGLTSLFTIGLVSTINPVMAWWETGHQTVALIAQNHISKTTKAKIINIIGNTGLDKISACADEIKFHPYKCTDNLDLEKNAASSNWHFIDIPLNSNPTESSLQEYCKNDDCLPNQIQKDINVLKDKNSTNFDKKVSLMYLVHFVGDLHEPLHCVDDNDKGGNDKKVSIEWGVKSKKRMNLHSIWDNIIQEDDPKGNISPETLDVSLEKDLAGKDTKEWTKGNISQWTIESFNIAKKVIYPEYKKVHGHLNKDYQAKMQLVAREQIEKGGIRLAKILDDIFSE